MKKKARSFDAWFKKQYGPEPRVNLQALRDWVWAGEDAARKLAAHDLRGKIKLAAYRSWQAAKEKK